MIEIADTYEEAVEKAAQQVKGWAGDFEVGIYGQGLDLTVVTFTDGSQVEFRGSLRADEVYEKAALYLGLWEW